MHMLTLTVAGQPMIVPHEQITGVYGGVLKRPAAPLATALGLNGATPAPRNVITQPNGRVWAVDKTGLPLNVPLTAIYRLPRLLARAAHPAVWALAHIDGQLLPVLNLDAIEPPAGA